MPGGISRINNYSGIIGDEFYCHFPTTNMGFLELRLLDYLCGMEPEFRINI
jgi:hypothetical protein